MVKTDGMYGEKTQRFGVLYLTVVVEVRDGECPRNPNTDGYSGARAGYRILRV